MLPSVHLKNAGAAAANVNMWRVAMQSVTDMLNFNDLILLSSSTDGS